MSSRFLLLIRGVSGAGKSTLADLICFGNPDVVQVSADEFMVDENGEYSFDHRKLAECHEKCQYMTDRVLGHGERSVAVHNTFSTEREIAPYEELAKKHGAKLISVIVENRHGNSNIHDVPESTIRKQAQRFSLKLSNLGAQFAGDIK